MNVKTTCIAVGTMLLSACASVPTEYHTIRPVIGETSTSMAIPAKNGQSVIAVRELSLPGYMDEQKIVYLKGNSQVIIADNHRWAEPLSRNLRDVVVTQLRNITGNTRTLSYPLANNIRPAHIVDIQIHEFAANQDDNTLKINANWQVTTPEDKTSSPPGYQFNRNYPLPGDDIDALMQGYQQATTDLSREIAKTLR